MAKKSVSERISRHRQDSRRSSEKIGLLYVAIAGFLSVPAHAAEPTYYLGYGFTYTTNIDRVRINERDEYIHSLVAGFSYEDATPTLNLRLLANAEYLYYVNETSENRTRPSLDASAIWAISPQRFRWTLEDNVRQVNTNSTQPNTPTNIVTANVLNTGPDFYLRIGPVNTLQLGGRVASVYVEDSEVDNVRRLGYARWLYQSSPLTTWSLNYEASTVDYKNEILNRNFTRQDYFVRVLSKPSRSSFDTSLGGSKIRQDGVDDVDGFLSRFSWAREINTGSVWGIVAEAGYGDTGTDLSASAAAANAPASGTGASTSQNLVVQGVFYAKRGTIFYRRLDSHLSTNLRVFVNNLRFDVVPLDDREESGGSAALTYLFTGTTSVGIIGDVKKSDYFNTARVDTDTNYGLRFSYLITRTLSSTLELVKSERDSTDPGLSFVDNRALFTVLYNSGFSGRR